MTHATHIFLIFSFDFGAFLDLKKFNESLISSVSFSTKENIRMAILPTFVLRIPKY